MADRRPCYHKAKKVAYMHTYEFMYAWIRVHDEESIFSKHDTDQKLEHDVLKARALIPSQFSVPIHRKGSKYDNDQTLPCLYRAKARCSIHRKGSMAHRGGKHTKYYMSKPLDVYTSRHARSMRRTKKLDVTYTANALASSGLRLSFELEVSNESLNANTDEYERLSAHASTRQQYPASPSHQPSQPTS